MNPYSKGYGGTVVAEDRAGQPETVEAMAGPENPMTPVRGRIQHSEAQATSRETAPSVATPATASDSVWILRRGEATVDGPDRKSVV